MKKASDKSWVKLSSPTHNSTQYKRWEKFRQT